MGAYYAEILYWKAHYGHPGVSDKRAVENFIDCETTEKVSSLRAQLHAVSHGKFDDRLFQKQLGAERRARHGNYSEWAKVMLLWMAGYRG